MPKKLPVESLTPRQIQEAQQAVAMTDLAHLRAWLQASDREFLTFLSTDLLDALAVDNLDVVPAFQQVVAAYTQHRMGIAYDVRQEKEPTTGEMIDVQIVKDDRLTLAEKDRLVRKLAGDLSDAFPGWSLNSPSIG